MHPSSHYINISIQALTKETEAPNPRIWSQSKYILNKQLQLKRVKLFVSYRQNTLLLLCLSGIPFLNSRKYFKPHNLINLYYYIFHPLKRQFYRQQKYISCLLYTHQWKDLSLDICLYLLKASQYLYPFLKAYRILLRTLLLFQLYFIT